jgi:hypothetical protein
MKHKPNDVRDAALYLATLAADPKRDRDEKTRLGRAAAVMCDYAEDIEVETERVDSFHYAGGYEPSWWKPFMKRLMEWKP